MTNAELIESARMTDEKNPDYISGCDHWLDGRDELASEIVTCEDCKRGDFDFTMNGKVHWDSNCPKMSEDYDPDGFCEKGERDD